MTTTTDPSRRDAVLSDLRARLLAVARRRVDPEAAEDVVQRAMMVIVERGSSLDGEGLDEIAGAPGLPPLAWCLTVLRNIIGNVYQRQRTEGVIDRGALLTEVESSHPTPLQALESAEAARAIEGALAALDTDGASCGRYLRALADGLSPRSLADQEGLSEAVLYRRVYRCRAKMREILLEKGLLP